MLDRLEAALRRVFLLCFNNPVTVVQLTSTVILFFLFSFTMNGWLDSQTREPLEVPLLLIGVFSILIIVLRTKSAFAISVSILIIGTVVAGDRFILAIATILKGGPTQESMNFVKDLYGSAVTPAAQPIDNEALASRITTIVKEKTPAAAELALTRVLGAAEAQSILNQIRLAGAETPFRELATGGESWLQFVRQYEEQSYFQKHMDILRATNVVTFVDQNFAEAELTAIGRQVKDQLDEAHPANRASLPDGPALSGINDPRLVPLEVGSRRIGKFEQYSRVFFKFTAPESASYVIETGESDSSVPDTVITLMNSDLSELGKDDDGGEGLFSRLERSLDSASYVIEVSSLGGESGEFSILVQKAEIH